MVEAHVRSVRDWKLKFNVCTPHLSTLHGFVYLPSSYGDVGEFNVW